MSRVTPPPEFLDDLDLIGAKLDFVDHMEKEMRSLLSPSPTHARSASDYTPISVVHRRKIKTEEKAKVVASVWGEEFIQFLDALAILPI